MESKPLVSVVMITYGHEHFIREAIEGVLMQKCAFEVELIVANDCSPDGTDAVVQELLRNHPNASWIKYFNHASNLGMMQNFLFALQQAKGEFIALCDGDDYWTDERKLEKQVRFLNENPSYVIHSSSSQILSDDKNNNTVFGFNNRNIFKLEDFYTQNNLVTSTVLFRNSNIKFPSIVNNLMFLDWFLYVILLNESKSNAYVSEEVYATYRVHELSVMSSLKAASLNDAYIKQSILIKKFIKLKLFADKDIKNINNYSIQKFRSLIDANDYFNAIKTFLLNLNLSNTRTPFRKYLKYFFFKKL